MATLHRIALSSHLLCPQLLDGRQRGHVDRGLGDGGRVELLGGALGAELGQVISEDLRSLVEHLLGLGGRGDQVLGLLGCLLIVDDEDRICSVYR